jgi:hypothetical protein
MVLRLWQPYSIAISQPLSLVTPAASSPCHPRLLLAGIHPNIFIETFQ